MEQSTALVSLYGKVPISALNASCRCKLSEMLNSEMLIASAAGYPRNWEGLAELIGLRYFRIKLLKNKSDPTSALIDEWEGNPCATVGKLIEHLQIMERNDVREDIADFIKRDGQRYLREQEEERLRLEARNPVQDPQVSSGDPVKYNMTVQEVIADQVAVEPWMETNADPMNYHAYVSYADTDVDFVQRLAEEMEGRHGLHLFIKDRDMLVGLLESEAQIKMMHDRCERILLVLSPDFFNDPKCEFQTIIAQAIQVEKNMYSRKVIPIIYKPCELPVRLRYVAHLDYSKPDTFGSFWTRLYTSIVKPNQKGSFSETMTGTFRLPLPTRERSPSIQSSSSMSTLMDIDQSSLSALQVPAAAAAGAATSGGRLSPNLNHDSGICMSSLKSASMSEGINTGAEPVITFTESVNPERPKRSNHGQKKSSTQKFLSALKKFNSGTNGNVSN